MTDQQSPRPVPGDPSREIVQAMLDIEGQEWWLTAPGDYQTAAVEAMRFDGSDWQRMIVQPPIFKAVGTISTPTFPEGVVVFVEDKSE